MPRTASVLDTQIGLASAARSALRLLMPGDMLSIQQRFRHTYLYAGSHGLVALVAPPASRSVCAIGIDERSFTGLADADHLLVGDKTLLGDRAGVRIVRSWRTRVNALPTPDAATLRDFAGAVATSERGLPIDAALEPRALIGLGTGLTPSGDDVVCGALAAARAFGSTRQVRELWAASEPGLAGTTSLSAQFVRSAAGGDVTAELLELLHGLARGDWRHGLDQLLRVGHCSGADLAHGVLLFLLRQVAAHHRDHHHEGETHR